MIFNIVVIVPFLIALFFWIRVVELRKLSHRFR